MRAAEWLGDGWGRVEEVSPQGPAAIVRGAQLALTAAVLPDGDWLLMWAGFDGEDDEILWSRRRTRSWSAPRRLHGDNPVPDIKPTVIATGNGALAAWSVFDDYHYRLRVARLTGDTWSLEPVSGGKGSIDPQALRVADRLLVLHRSVIPNGWTLLELDRDGALLRRGFVDEATSYGPLVFPTASGDIELRWSGSTATTRTPDWEPLP